MQIIPLINKIDLKTAKVESTIEQMAQTLEIKKEDVILASAKNGTNCDLVLKEIVKRIQPYSEFKLMFHIF